jgi:hypothetical protein
MTHEWTLLCPCLDETAGHEAEYVERLAAVAIDHGHAIRAILPKRSAVDLGHIAVDRLLPGLRTEYPARSLAQRLARKGARLLEQQIRHRAYRELFQGGHPHTNWLLHTAPLPEVAIALSAFMQVRTKPDIGRLKIILRADHHDDPLRIRQFRVALSAAGSRVDIYTDTRELADMMTPLTTRPVGVVPIPGTTPAERPAFPRVVLFGYFGLRRLSKGFDRLPYVLDALPYLDGAGLRFRAVIHDSNIANPAEDHDAATAAITARGGVLSSERLTGTEYAEALAQTDIAVMPYSVKEYRFGSSGVFVDALHAGCAAIVPEGTWMAKEAERHGLRGVFAADFDNASSIAAAAVQAIDFRARPSATPVNKQWLEENSPTGLFQALSRHIAS